MKKEPQTIEEFKLALAAAQKTNLALKAENSTLEACIIDLESVFRRLQFGKWLEEDPPRPGITRPNFCR